MRIRLRTRLTEADAPRPRETKASADDRGQGFTLLELLIVIAVIGIISALLLPALSQAKNRGKRVVCLNNLKQFALADVMYSQDYGYFPDPNPMVPSSTKRERLATLAQYLGVNIPSGPISKWPRRGQQPPWMNCPMAKDSGIAEGVTLGGGIYTGYVYVGGLAQSAMVSNGLATLENPRHTADRAGTNRGVIWADILDEYQMSDDRRFEFFHVRNRVQYPDFRFHAGELEGFHRAWSDASVEWVAGNQIDLNSPRSPDLQIRHTLGNFYY